MQLHGITKRFGATVALDDVSFGASPGEIVAVVGENGAGKSTLMRIAAGELLPDAGHVERPGDVALVHQHFMLVSELTVAENLALWNRRGPRFATRTRLEQEAARVIASCGIDLGGASRRVASLSVGEKSKLELIKAIAGRPAVLVLDEPTSVLTPRESDDLFRVMRRLAAGGTAVVFISHKLAEVLQVAQRVVVMRQGRVVAERPADSATPHELASAMVGTSAPAESIAEAEGAAIGLPPASAGRRTVVSLDAVSGRILERASLAVHAGEIVAVVGVAGNGQRELAALLRGIESPRSGTLTIDARAVGHVPEDRSTDGIVASMSIAENLALGARTWNPRRAARHAAQMITLYAIRAAGPDQRAGDLSGGNQQKVILARELDRRPDLVVAAEPTRGLDIEATRFVHVQLRAAAASGSAILLITSDLDEAFALAHGVHVIYRGRLSPRLTPADARASVATLMAGIA